MKEKRATKKFCKPEFDPTTEQGCPQALPMSGCQPQTPSKAEITFSTMLFFVLTLSSSTCSVEKDAIDEFFSPELFASDPAGKEMLAAEVLTTELTDETFAAGCSLPLR